MDEKAQRPGNFPVGFQSRKRLFPVFFGSNGQITVDFLPEKSTHVATYNVKTVISKMMQSVVAKRSIVGTKNTPYLHDRQNSQSQGKKNPRSHPHTLQSTL